MAALPPRPVSNPTAPFWRTSPSPLDSTPTLTSLPSNVDILIIGGGYAGASIAHHILEARKSLKDSSKKVEILILEARELCSGATGRNGGHLKPDPFIRFASTLSEHGFEAAEEATRFETEHVSFMKEFIEGEKDLDCDFRSTMTMDVATTMEEATELKGAWERATAAGGSDAKKVKFTDGERAEEVSGVRGAKAVFSYPAGHLWPYKLVLHLLNKCVLAGVNMMPNTPVEKVSPTPDAEFKWTVTTGKGEVKAKTVVFATNAYTSSLLPEYTDKIIPVFGTVCRILTPHPPPNTLALRNTYIIRSPPNNYDYMIPRPDGSIILGGAQSAYGDDRRKWYGNFDDGVIPDGVGEYFEGYMQKWFKGWEGSGAAVERIWGGVMGWSSDNCPHIGQVPGRPGMYICAGFTGHGMPQAFLAARGVAAMIVEGKAFSETGVPKIWQTSQQRLDSKINKFLDDEGEKWT